MPSLSIKFVFIDCRYLMALPSWRLTYFQLLIPFYCAFYDYRVCVTTFIAARNLHKGVAEWRKLFAVAARVVYTCWCQSLMHVKAAGHQQTPLLTPSPFPFPAPHPGLHSIYVCAEQRGDVSKATQSLASRLGQINCNQLRFPLTDVAHGTHNEHTSWLRRTCVSARDICRLTRCGSETTQ